MEQRFASAPSSELDESGEPIVVIVPHRSPARVVGPGRRERAYLVRVADLEAALGEAEATRSAQARALELAALVDRGAARRMDKLEGALGEQRREVQALNQRENRWILALGALQRENELLRERFALASRPALLGRPRARAPRQGFWAALVERVRGSRA